MDVGISGLAAVPGTQPIGGAASGLPNARPLSSHTEGPAHAFAQLLERKAGSTIVQPPSGAVATPVSHSRGPERPAHLDGVAHPTAKSALQAAISALHELAQQIHNSETRVDSLLAAARQGRSLSSTQLLALQAEVFRYSQAVEIVSRTTDRLIAGLKQALNTQV